MNKIKIPVLFLLSILFSGCFFDTATERIIKKNAVLDNTSASLCILNLNNDDIIAELEYEKGKTETFTIQQLKVSGEAKETMEFYTYPITDKFIVLIGKIFDPSFFTDSCYCPKIIDNNLKSVKIKSADGTMLYSSEFDKTVTYPHLKCLLPPWGIEECEDELKDFSEHKFLFTNRPGDYLFVSFEGETERKKEFKCDYIMNNIRYFIIMGDMYKYAELLKQE